MTAGQEWFSNDKAAVLIAALVALQVLSIAFFLGLTRPTSGYATGQVLGVVQNEPPSNYYFNADAATETYGGKPAFRLSIGGTIVMDGKASDLNGYGELVSYSTCTWTATAFSSTTAVSFNTCNSTDCNYTCSLTLSSSTPSGTYNVTSDISDSVATSELSQLIHVFEFAVSTGGGSGSSGSGHDILILQPAPSPKPSQIPSPSPSPSAKPGASIAPTQYKEFDVSIAAPDFINKCEVKEVEVIVSNNNPSRKSVALDFQGRVSEMELQPYEVRSLFYKIKAPKADGETSYALTATLYHNGNAVAQETKAVRLLWHGLDVCITPTPAREFVFIAGRQSEAKVLLEIATDLSPSTLEAEFSQQNNLAFADLIDTADGYHNASFSVFEKGEYGVKVRVRKGFETLQQKFEKAQIG